MSKNNELALEVFERTVLREILRPLRVGINYRSLKPCYVLMYSHVMYNKKNTELMKKIYFY